MINSIDKKFNKILNSEESETTEKRNIENDDLFDDFGFNQIKIWYYLQSFTFIFLLFNLIYFDNLKLTI